MCNFTVEGNGKSDMYFFTLFIFVNQYYDFKASRKIQKIIKVLIKCYNSKMIKNQFNFSYIYLNFPKSLVSLVFLVIH